MKIKNCALKRLVYFVAAFFILAGLLILAVSLTKAWIENNVSPALQANQIQLNTSPGIVMTIEGVQTDLINLNDYLTSPSNKAFILSEMTSVDGEIMYIRDASTGSTSSSAIKLKLADESDKNTSYIDFTLQLTANAEDGESSVPIYLGDETKPELTYLEVEGSDGNANAIYPIRLYLAYSYTYTDQDGQSVTNTGANIFAHDANYPTYAVQTIDNSSYLLDGPQTSVEEQDLSSLSTYYVKYDSEGEVSSNSTPWFNLPDGATATIRMKIWLEGCDQYCLDAISGSSLQMLLTFFTPQTAAQ